MGLFSNISAMSHPLFKGVTRQTKALQKARRPLRELLLPEPNSAEHQMDMKLAQDIKKATARMRKQGINPDDDYLA